MFRRNLPRWMKAQNFCISFIKFSATVDKQCKDLIVCVSFSYLYFDVVINNSNEISDTFNDHFSTIGPRLANEIPPIGQNDDSSYTNFITCNNKTFHFCPTSGNIVFSHLNKLSRSKATGLDNISARLIRECADLISVSLSDFWYIS